MIHFLRSARNDVPYTSWSVDSLCELHSNDVLKLLTLGFEMYITGCNIPQGHPRPVIRYFRQLENIIDAYHSNSETSDPLSPPSVTLSWYDVNNISYQDYRQYAAHTYCNDSRPTWVMSYDLSNGTSDTSDPLNFRRRLS